VDLLRPGRAARAPGRPPSVRPAMDVRSPAARRRGSGDGRGHGQPHHPRHDGPDPGRHGRGCCAQGRRRRALARRCSWPRALQDWDRDERAPVPARSLATCGGRRRQRVSAVAAGAARTADPLPRASFVLLGIPWVTRRRVPPWLTSPARNPRSSPHHRRSNTALGATMASAADGPRSARPQPPRRGRRRRVRVTE